MGILSGLVTWPLLPVKGVTALSNTIWQQAEQQQRSPARIRHQLEELEGLPEDEQQEAMGKLTQEWIDSQGS